MAQPPRVKGFSRESVPGAPAWMEGLFPLLNESTGQAAAALANRLTFAENHAAQVKDISFIAPRPVWRTPAAADYLNGWALYGDADYGPVRYRIDHLGEVEWQGLVAGGSMPGDILPLPDGYVPERSRILNASSDTGRAEVRVMHTSSRLYAVSGGTTWLALDGIRYKATNPALPDAPADAGWPVLVKHSLPRVSMVLPVYCRALDVTPKLSSGAPSLEWDLAQDGNVRLRNVHGLTAGRKYQMRLLLCVG